ncbi:glycosyltransferase family 2 protein [Marinicella sp. S1101]|uniref:glycosyltransferase family 2 protein n=1 Tax=Marinicella marina TaxID=2996016 RepID=UPI00226091C5|nr:glycosyltransferase family 2 protein [Marinicella marina]MCX7552650.1 glycosyltransferase family 2 protein [Marinicella marina]MDJ1139526.1 glycosyltransferase family 2 protein [Marinicella marina]
MHNIDVVVVNYNAGDVLQQCLSKLVKGIDSGINVVVVDNHSTDDSLVRLKKQSFAKQLKLIENLQNSGFAKGCNQGAAAGEGEFLAFINPDCFISHEQLQSMVAELSRNQQAAMIGCRVLNTDGTLQAASRRRLPTFWRILFQLTRLSHIPGVKGVTINSPAAVDGVLQVEAVNGACMVVRRRSFDAIDGFDESFPLHFEDLDLFARLKAVGHDIIYIDSVAVTHLKGHSSKNTREVSQWKRQGLLRYLKKHRPRWEYQVTKWLLGAK